MDDPCSDLGGGVPPICIKIKDPMCGILRAIQVMSFQYLVVSIKNIRFKYQPSIPRATLCIKRCTSFMKIADKGGEISTKILREVGFRHGHGQRRSNIEEWRRIKNSWTREAHK